MIATVYKLHDKNGLVYFGSTRQKLYQRLSEHRYKNHVRPSTSSLLDYDSMEATVLEEHEFSEGEYDVHFMRERERYYIELFECVNIRVPSRTQKELSLIRKLQSNESGLKS